jgi:hypothetical protein
VAGGAYSPSRPNSAVRDPWPHSIGLGFPFALAGAFGVLADLVYAEASKAQRDRVSNEAGVFGFRLGAGIYAVSLLVQVIFQL